MYRSSQRKLDPFRLRWGAGKGTTGRTLRASASLLRRSRGGPPLLVLALWILPACLLDYLSLTQLQQGGTGEAYNLTGLMDASTQTSWAALGTGLLDLLRGWVITPLLLYALGRIFLGELALARPGPVQAVRGSVLDWRRALWVALLCVIGTRLLGYLPTLVGYVFGLLVALLTALLSWIPGLVTATEWIATMLMTVLQSFTYFVTLCLSFCVWMTVSQRELRGMAAVIEGIQMMRERVGFLGRLYLVCFLPYLLGAQGIWLLDIWLDGGLFRAVLLVLSPLITGAALLLMCAGSAQLCYGGGGAVREHISPKDISHMKSANIE